MIPGPARIFDSSWLGAPLACEAKLRAHRTHARTHVRGKGERKRERRNERYIPRGSCGAHTHARGTSARSLTHSLAHTYTCSPAPAMWTTRKAYVTRVQVHNTQPYILLSRSYSPSTLSPLLDSSPRSLAHRPFPPPLLFFLLLLPSPSPFSRPSSSPPPSPSAFATDAASTT